MTFTDSKFNANLGGGLKEVFRVVLFGVCCIGWPVAGISADTLPPGGAVRGDCEHLFGATEKESTRLWELARYRDAYRARLHAVNIAERCAETFPPGEERGHILLASAIDLVIAAELAHASGDNVAASGLMRVGMNQLDSRIRNGVGADKSDLRDSRLFYRSIQEDGTNWADMTPR